MSSSLLKINQLAMAVDSHSWEDFPSYHLGDDGAEVLVGWTALWHPALIKAAGKLPTWLRTDVWPEQPEGLLLVVPSFALEQLPDNMASRLSDLGGQLVASNPSRQQLTASIFREIGMEAPLDRPEITQDFYSLGYCYLQVQLMTRQLRHSSGLDDELLATQVMKVFAAIESGQIEDYTTAMQACFDILIEERSRYYPTMANLVDYVLLTPATLGSGLQATLRQKNPLSLQASGETIDAILADEQLTDSIKKRLQDETLTLAGGEYHELPTALLPTWTSVREFQKGRLAFDQLVGKQDQPVYARRTFGLRVGLPALLEQFGIECLVHCTIDDGVFPQTSGHHIRWEGDDHSTVDGLVAPPLLAGKAETWLNLAVRIGEMIDVNHYATMLLVHWPGQVCEFYEDAINSCRFGAVLGSFVTLQTYFDEASDPGFTQHYSVDDYRGPWLEQMVTDGETNPLSRFARFWRDHARTMQSNGWAAMQWLLGSDENATKFGAAVGGASIGDRLDAMVDRFRNSNETSVEVSSNELTLNDVKSSIDDGMNVVAKPTEVGSIVTVVNPFSFPRVVKVPFSVAVDHPAVLLTDESESLVKLPAMGFANLKESSNEANPPGKPGPPLAVENVLQNEFFKLEINPATGGIGAIKKHNSRANMLSQQLAQRGRSQRQSRGGGSDVKYSTMHAEKIEIVSQSRIEASIRSLGNLTMGDRQVAEFQQTCTIRRGQPIVTIDIDLDFSCELSGNPWQNYVACRFAWENSSAILSTWHNDSRHPLSRPRMIAPLAIEIDQDRFTTSVLTGGLPFHQKIGERQLDSLLIVSGEQNRSFCLGIGINLPLSDRAGLDFMAETLQAELPGLENRKAFHAWLFHLNCKNVIALNWQQTESKDGQAGVKILLKETAGRAADLSIRCVQSLVAASVSLLDGTPIRDLEVRGDLATLSMSPLEMKQVELFW